MTWTKQFFQNSKAVNPKCFKKRKNFSQLKSLQLNSGFTGLPFGDGPRKSASHLDKPRSAVKFLSPLQNCPGSRAPNPLALSSILSRGHLTPTPPQNPSWPSQLIYFLSWPIGKKDEISWWFWFHMSCHDRPLSSERWKFQITMAKRHWLEIIFSMDFL